MTTRIYKGKKIGNSVSMYMHYKQISNRNLTSDLSRLSGIAKIAVKLDKGENLSDEEEKVLAENDIVEIILYIWCALRLAADKEAREMPIEELINELDNDDLSDNEFVNMLIELLSPKKKGKLPLFGRR